MPHRLALLLVAALFGSVALAGCGSDPEPASPADSEERAVAVSPDADPVVLDVNGSRFNPSRVYADTIDGVVSVRSVFGNPEQNPAGAAAAGGSGFVFSEDGLIVTNAHVISDESGGSWNPADQVFVEFSDGDVLNAEVLGLDPFADVGLLRVEEGEVELKPLPLTDSNELVVGQPIAVIGSPFGEHQTLTTGIISQTGRSVRSLTDFQIEGAIQTDASINPGNSGGPMLDGNGRVIGISQQMKSGSGASNGVGFGVPANSIRRSVAMLEDGGEPSYAYIGVSTQPLYPQLAEKLGLDVERGAIVAEVVEGGPAEAAGIKGGGRELVFQGSRWDVGGDVIVGVNGVEIRQAEDLGRVIGALKPGETAEIEVIRNGDRRTVDVELETRPTALDRR